MVCARLPLDCGSSLAVATPPLAVLTAPGTLVRRHGIAHQEAPEAHAQEEAQEDAQAHPLPTPRQEVATYGVRATTRPSPGNAPSTNHVEPLPASTGVRPVASPRRSRY